MKRVPCPREERANSWSHAVGVVLGLATWVGLPLWAADTGWLTVLALATYGLCLTALFTTSTVYHRATCPTRKGRWQKADHCAIYLLIAGTYTPFTLLVLQGTLGWSLFAVVWGLAALGLGQELWFTERRERVSLTLYVVMGWLILVALGPLLARTPGLALTLLVVGGLLYSGGIVFYVRDRPWDHAIWHGFVLGGATAHAGALAVALA